MATLALNLPVNGHGQNKSLTYNFTNSCNLTWKFSKKSIHLTCALSATTKTIEKTAFLPKPEKSSNSISEKWREIHGEDDWAGLLDPMDPLLRAEMIRYGEMAQACYGAFDNDPYSKYCGSCKFQPKTFFQDLGMEGSGYEITSYIYSSNTSNLIPKFFTKSIRPNGPWNPMANWMGYVAVSNDETTARLGRRDVTIAWRGTVTKLEWMEDLMDFLKPVSAQNLASRDPNIKVMAGFLHIYTDKDQSCPYSKFSAREQVLAEVARLMKLYGGKGEELSITITGHSLGSALATLSAYDIAETGVDLLDNMQDVPVSVFSFSGPRVGNTRFQKRVEALGVKVLRVFNVHDKVPNVPGLLFNEYTPSLIHHIGDWTPWCYAHVGEELVLDHTISPFLKEIKDFASLHNLELLLHLLDGYHGKGRRFWLASGRDKALVNKESDILKDEHLIPPKWSQVENKGLRKNQNGEWRLPDQNGVKHHSQPEVVEHHLRELGLA